MSDPRSTLAQLIANAVAERGATLAPDEAQALFADPPNRELGDVAFPCFVLARQLRSAPQSIAAELAEALQGPVAAHPMLAAIQATGPYLNVRFDASNHASGVVRAALADTWGRDHDGRTVGIDYSSPNIAKPFGIGHLRSTAIGAALARTYAELGWSVVGVNHLGDWGTQFGKLMSAFERWGDEAALDADPIGHLYDLYVRFHRDAAEDPALDDEGRAWFKRLEDDDETAHAYWQRFRDLSLREFQRIYDRLGVSFDHFWGEAYYNDMLEPLCAELDAAGLTEQSEGATVVNLDDLDMPPCLIRKSDGATLYATRDLAAARYRHDALGFDRFLYVVGVGQSVHFRQVFAVLERMGYAWAADLVHVPFGLIQGISTRRGTLVFLEDILDEGRRRVREIVADREHLNDDEKDAIAEQVAIGAVVFYDLSRNRIKDYEFDWDLMMRGLKPGEPGRTGPYLQYTHVRMAAVEDTYRERFGELPDANTADLSPLADEAAAEVIATLERYPDVLRGVVEHNEPSLLARYLLDLAGAFNSFYSGGHRVVSDDQALSAARVTLVAAVRRTLGRGLTLLGVPLPTRM